MFERRNENSSTCVYVLRKTSHVGVSRRRRAVTSEMYKEV